MAAVKNDVRCTPVAQLSAKRPGIEWSTVYNLELILSILSIKSNTTDYSSLFLGNDITYELETSHIGSLYALDVQYEGSL